MPENKKATSPDILVMSQLFRLLFLLAVGVLFLSCNKEDEFPHGNFNYDSLSDGIPDSVKYFENPPYPIDADTLRILIIGNSFSSDAMTYMDTLVKASGIDEGRVCLYEACESRASLTTWTEIFHHEKTVTLQHRAGRAAMSTEGTLPQLLNQSWNVIVVQQVSNYSYVWSSYATLKEYVELITSSCPNKNVCLAFHLTWSHRPSEMPYVLQGNIACCQKMSQRYGIDVIIPTGTAIQLARGTRLNDAAYMTRDQWHLNLHIASYIASCTWFEALLRPVFGVPVVGNASRPQRYYSEADILLGQQCAEQAVLHPYESEWEQGQNALESSDSY